MSEESEYGLVMPFVITSDVGGPYDPTAFVSGYRCAVIDKTLELSRPLEHRTYVYPAEVPQLDLIAMHHGYSLECEPWDEHPDEWTLATFVRQASDTDEGGGS